jgi:hypothetical protein
MKGSRESHSWIFWTCTYRPPFYLQSVGSVIADAPGQLCMQRCQQIPREPSRTHEDPPEHTRTHQSPPNPTKTNHNLMKTQPTRTHHNDQNPPEARQNPQRPPEFTRTHEYPLRTTRARQNQWKLLSIKEKTLILPALMLRWFFFIWAPRPPGPMSFFEKWRETSILAALPLRWTSYNWVSKLTASMSESVESKRKQRITLHAL